MKTTISTLLTSIFMLVFCSVNYAQQVADKPTCKLNIHFENLQSSKGNVVLKLYNSESPKFPDTKSAIAIKTVKIENGKALISFENLPHGKYAYSCFHDENSNGIMDTNMIHFPTEGYAFSNNLKIKFGPPSFEKACFQLNKELHTIKVALAY